MSDQELKVTDKRMFTPDGELREEYRHLEEKKPAGSPPPAGREAEKPEAEKPEADRVAPDGAAPDGATSDRAASDRAASDRAVADRAAARETGESRARVEIPDSPSALREVAFLDLVAMLAEPAALYLGDARLPDGRSAENLDMARLHIDLLEILRQKTVGNLSHQEAEFFDDLLYKLRLRYVHKRG